ncbi:MAG: metal ABC transporter permease [Planctomycetota bacterium]
MIELWTLAIALVTALACALSGSFLVLKREALVSEGLAHAVLPGIVIAFVLTGDRTSPLLLVGAAAMGLAMILAVQAIRRTGVVDPTASLGVVFPALFSVGVLLSSLELAGVHFHADCIIEGNLALAPLDRLELLGRDLGPRAFWSVSTALSLVGGFVLLLFKELKLLSFDTELAASLGFRPGRVHLAWLAVVSFTIVASFEAAGSILVVALMIAPAAAAVLWVNDVRQVLALAAAIALLSAFAGHHLGLALDIAPAGPMATSAGGLFLASLALAPRGILRQGRSHRRSLARLEVDLVAARLESGEPRDWESVRGELGWTTRRFGSAVSRAVSGSAVVHDTGAHTLHLSPGQARR